MSVVAFIRRCLAVGMDHETALAAAEQFEAAVTDAPVLTKRQARNKRYYENRRLRSSEQDGDASEPSEQDVKTQGVLETKGSPRPLLKTQSPQEAPSPPSGAHGSRVQDAFEEVWRAYPHVKGRSSKRKALAEWGKTAAATRRALPAAVDRYRAEGREPKADCGAPAFERWLRDERYLDWLPVVAVPTRQFTQAEKDAHDARILGLGSGPSAVTPTAADGDLSTVGSGGPGVFGGVRR